MQKLIQSQKKNFDIFELHDDLDSFNLSTPSLRKFRKVYSTFYLFETFYMLFINIFLISNKVIE
jgi:hypothetical protein